MNFIAKLVASVTLLLIAARASSPEGTAFAETIQALPAYNSFMSKLVQVASAMGIQNAANLEYAFMAYTREINRGQVDYNVQFDTMDTCFTHWVLMLTSKNRRPQWAVKISLEKGLRYLDAVVSCDEESFSFSFDPNDPNSYEELN